MDGRRLILTVVALAVAGCATPPVEDAAVPVAVSVAQIAGAEVAPPKWEKSQAVMRFEGTVETAFVRTTPTNQASVRLGRAHSGAGALYLAPGTRETVFNLRGAVGPTLFPNAWTMVAVSVWCDTQTTVAAETRVNGTPGPRRLLSLRPGAWSLVLVDLPRAAESSSGPAELVFSFDKSAGVVVDDVTLVDNAKTYVEKTSTGVGVQRLGLNYIIQYDALTTLSLPTLESDPHGWEIEEANAVRATFHPRAAEPRMTIYSDGRMVVGGRIAPADVAMVTPDQIIVAQHDHPVAVVTVPEDQGRLDRKSPGDANNDGYVESRGAYRVVASGAKIQIAIDPAGAKLLRPVFEIAGLPPGKVLCTLEGKLVENTAREIDGTVVVMLPGIIDRTMTASVRVE